MKDYKRQEICKLRHVEPSTPKSQIHSILKKFEKDRRISRLIHLRTYVLSVFAFALFNKRSAENEEENSQ